MRDETAVRSVAAGILIKFARLTRNLEGNGLKSTSGKMRHSGRQSVRFGLFNRAIILDLSSEGYLFGQGVI